eukprot:300221-Pyramimonas_sp.AAC.1
MREDRVASSTEGRSSSEDDALSYRTASDAQSVGDASSMEELSFDSHGVTTDTLAYVEDLEAQLADLLICLGQEEQKNSALCDALRTLKVDPEVGYTHAYSVLFRGPTSSTSIHLATPFHQNPSSDTTSQTAPAPLFT